MGAIGSKKMRHAPICFEPDFCHGVQLGNVTIV